MSTTTTQATSAAAADTNNNLSSQLQEWTQTSFADLYILDKDPQAQTLFTPNAQITVNGDVLSPEKFNEHITELRGGATHIDIAWGDILVTPDYESHSILFKGSYTITRSLRIRIRAGPAQTLTHVVLEAQVVEVDSAPKIASLLQTETFEQPPVHISPVPAGTVSSQGVTAEVDNSQGS